jgi:hypothetical protein
MRFVIFLFRGIFCIGFEPSLVNVEDFYFGNEVLCQDIHCPPLSDGPLNTEGSRSIQKIITFLTVFTQTPQVGVHFIQYDDASHDCKIDFFIEAITMTGFRLTTTQPDT